MPKRPDKWDRMTDWQKWHIVLRTFAEYLIASEGISQEEALATMNGLITIGCELWGEMDFMRPPKEGKSAQL